MPKSHTDNGGIYLSRNVMAGVGLVILVAGILTGMGGAWASTQARLSSLESRLVIAQSVQVTLAGISGRLDSIDARLTTIESAHQLVTRDPQ